MYVHWIHLAQEQKACSSERGNEHLVLKKIEISVTS
jgi:hypothetical protein